MCHSSRWQLWLISLRYRYELDKLEWSGQIRNYHIVISNSNYFYTHAFYDRYRYRNPIKGIKYLLSSAADNDDDDDVTKNHRISAMRKHVLWMNAITEGHEKKCSDVLHFMHFSSGCDGPVTVGGLVATVPTSHSQNPLSSSTGITVLFELGVFAPVESVCNCHRKSFLK